MNDVKAIFSNTHKLCKLYHSDELFKAIIKNIYEIPFETATQILSETYTFYTDWKEAKNPEDWKKMNDEMHRLDKWFNCKLCTQILLVLMEQIEEEYRRRQSDQGL